MSKAGSESGRRLRHVDDSVVDTPDDVSLEEFKNQVKVWMQIDNDVKQMTLQIRERRKVQKMLTNKILDFMSKYNIEDLNTKDGKLRYKVRKTKPAIKPTEVKQKLLEYYADNAKEGEKVLAAVFDTSAEQALEKPSLRRLKGVRVMNV